LVAGNPGTGKTIMGCSFLYRGASDLGEAGVYASFAESKTIVYQNAARMGFDFEALERAGKLKFLDLISVKKEGIASTISFVLETVSNHSAKRLFIDSFTALMVSFDKT
jgi:circadian clock protein KaiC